MLNHIEITEDNKANKIDQFWSTDLEGKIKFKVGPMRSFLTRHGYRKLVNSKTDYTLVQIIDGKVSEVAPFKIRDYLVEYCKRHDLHDELEAFLEDNAVINLIPYGEFPGYVWETQVIQHDFKQLKWNDAVYKEFIYRISGLTSKNRLSGEMKLDQARIDSLRSVIGYCLHNFKDKRTSKAIILNDMALNEHGEANGGTGKGLFVQGLSKLRNTIFKDGKHLKPGSNRFFYQDWELGTDLMFFDDVNEDFDISDLFPAITTGIHAERKYKRSQFIPFNISPKIIVATNYVVKGPPGASTERRKYEFELSDYYGLDHTPEDDFGHILFDEWDEVEWIRFYSFMFSCLQLYLNEGLIEYERINLSQKRLNHHTTPSFARFVKRRIKFNTEYNKQELHREYNIFYNPDLSSHMFTKYLAKYAMLKHGKYSERQSNGNYLFTIYKVL